MGEPRGLEAKTFDSLAIIKNNGWKGKRCSDMQKVGVTVVTWFTPFNS